MEDDSRVKPITTVSPSEKPGDEVIKSDPVRTISPSNLPADSIPASENGRRQK